MAPSEKDGGGFFESRTVKTNPLSFPGKQSQKNGKDHRYFIVVEINESREARVSRDSFWYLGELSLVEE